MSDDGLERLLGYDRRRYWLANGWSLRFRVWRTTPTPAWPRGLRYSMTLHDVDGARLLGFDNAHGVSRGIGAFDHEHRAGRVADPQPYRFVDADTLLADFFLAVERACRDDAVDCVIIEEDRFGADLSGGNDEDLG